MCEGPLLFAQRFGRNGRRTLARRHLPVLAYLLKVQPNIKQLIELGELVPLAHDIFGKGAVDRALEPPFAVLRGWGYSLKESCNPAACLAYLLMWNESPYLVRMLEFVQLTEDEKLLVTEGIELHQALIEKLVDMPTPAGPTPRELEAQRQAEMKVIPIKSVGRHGGKQQKL
jgi:hypothetical protein